jgi:hypothetical protein
MHLIMTRLTLAAEEKAIATKIGLRSASLSALMTGEKIIVELDPVLTSIA